MADMGTLKAGMILVSLKVLNWCNIIDLLKMYKFEDNNCVKCRMTRWLQYKKFLAFVLEAVTNELFEVDKHNLVWT
jgi:hypothetical protein